MSEFGFTTTVEPRYSDIDTYEHVNHAVHATYMEQARMRFFRDAVGQLRIDTVIVNLEVDYERPIQLTDEVEIGVGVVEIGETSLTLAYDIRAGGEPAASGRTTQVILDGGDPTPIPEDWLDALAEHRVDAEA
ncbi:acyl-CoA thioester hydrolase [Natronoarchaeum philippinense]|uniref:Acyl-CoA thioester hydrolase n=1 Tax=Natronoarchaeum philippinense TaxID=558529 RepID=A0A285NY50_NATPI|nr:thioesterase family protein [Natronoarchaeum philippinense]SNZ12571.1 acyl-CoA thioester hydrolase [Natronoarchaeum philippinense]